MKLSNLLKKGFKILFFLALFPTNAIAQDSIVIPFEYKYNWIYIDVKINDHIYPFMYDTGASGFGRIDSTVVAELDLPVTGEVDNSDGINSSKINVVNVSSISIGSLTLKEVDFLSRNYNRGFEEVILNGIIGKEFFADYLVTLDYSNKVIILDKGILNNGFSNTISYEGEMIIDLKIGSEIYKAKIDTGSSLFLHLPMPISSEINVSKLVESGSGRRANTEFKFYKGKINDVIHIANCKLDSVNVVFSDKAKIINMGTQFLSMYKITFDFKNQLVRFIQND